MIAPLPPSYWDLTVCWVLLSALVWCVLLGSGDGDDDHGSAL
jgi:hypothetical protein